MKRLVHIAIYLLSIMISMIFLNVFMVDQELYDATRTGKLIFILQYLPFLVVIALPVLFNQVKSKLDWLSGTLLVFMGWICFIGRPGYIWNSEKFLYWVAAFIFFWITKYGIRFGKRNEQKWSPLLIPILAICLIGFTEALLGQLQIMNAYTIYHSIYKVTGTFFNPAPFAGFLTACLPYALMIANPTQNEKISKILSWAGIGAAMMMVSILPATQSRAAWIAVLVSVSYFSIYHFHVIEKIKSFYLRNVALTKGLIAGSLILLFIAGYGLYQFKKDSADGRLLIWKVAANVMTQNPLSGTGFDTFQAHYAPGLAYYFQSGQGTKAEEMLADNVQWAFNEPLQMGVELGMPGMLLFLTVILVALFTPISKEANEQVKQWVYISRASLIGVVVFGLFSYPFHSPAILLLFFFALAVIAAYAVEIQTFRTKAMGWLSRGVNVLLMLSMMGFALHCFIYTPKLKHAYWLWDEAESLYQIKAYEAAVESFEEAQPILKANGLFMQQYGKCLQMAGHYEKAGEILKESGQYYKDDFWYLTLGEVNKEMGNLKETENFYLMASQIVPRKLYPKYLLAKLYDATGQKQEADAMANDILTSEVKVMSTAVKEIQQEMRGILAKSMVKLRNKSEPEAEQGNSHASGSSVPSINGKEVQR